MSGGFLAPTGVPAYRGISIGKILSLGRGRTLTLSLSIVTMFLLGLWESGLLCWSARPYAYQVLRVMNRVKNQNCPRQRGTSSYASKLSVSTLPPTGARWLWCAYSRGKDWLICAKPGVNAHVGISNCNTSELRMITNLSVICSTY